MAHGLERSGVMEEAKIEPTPLSTFLGVEVGKKIAGRLSAIFAVPLLLDDINDYYNCNKNLVL